MVPFKNHLFVTEIVREAGNLVSKFEKFAKKWASELGWGWEICYKLNIDLHLNSLLLHNINCNSLIE